MTKKLLLLLLLFNFCNLSYADTPKAESKPVLSNLQVKLSGYAHFQSGFRSQDKLTGDEKNVSANRESFAFYNDTALFFDISNMINDIVYGGKIILVTTAKRKGSGFYNGSHIYFQTEYGRIEAGSPISASKNMFVDGGAVSSATGGDWDRYAEFESTHLKQGKELSPDFATFDEFFLDSKLVSTIENRSYSTEPGRRISYYTPKFDFIKNGELQIGFSYTPDSSNTGADSPSKNSTAEWKKKISDTERFEFDKSVKNAFSGGAILTQNISDAVDFKLSLTGEYGKSADAKKITTDKEGKESIEAIYKLADLRTYNVGAVLTVGNFSYAASFGSLGKSLTTAEFHKTGRNTDYYMAGAAYKQGPFSTSISYFKSERYRNTVDSITVGTDYILAPGFKPYAEVSSFTLKGRPEFYPELKKKKSRGTVALIGAKLSL